MTKFLGNHYGNTYTPMDAGAEFCGPPYAGRGGNDSASDYTPAGGGGVTGPVTIIENTAAHGHRGRTHGSRNRVQFLRILPARRVQPVRAGYDPGRLLQQGGTRGGINGR